MVDGTGSVESRRTLVTIKGNLFWACAYAASSRPGPGISSHTTLIRKPGEAARSATPFL
jgi:hypothetical protein